MWYYSAPKNWKQSEEDTDPSELVEIICPHLHDATKYLPRKIELKDNLGFMRLRSFPCVLRMHKFKESHDPHQFFYSELLLYKHWRNEEDLREDDQEKCFELFNEPSPNDQNKSYISEVKDKIFPE